MGQELSEANGFEQGMIFNPQGTEGKVWGHS